MLTCLISNPFNNSVRYLIFILQLRELKLRKLKDTQLLSSFIGYMRVRVLSRFSHAQLSAALWTVACRAPLSMGFSRQEYWSELPCHPPGDLPNPGIKPWSPTLQADSLPFEPPGYLCAKYEKCLMFTVLLFNWEESKFLIVMG